MQANLIKQILALFYSTSDEREYLRAPLEYKGNLLACDGRMFVVVDATPYDANIQANSAPDNIVSVVNHHLGPNFACDNPLPDIPEDDTDEKACDECNGSGTISFSTDKHEYDVTCKECDGFAFNIKPIPMNPLPDIDVPFDVANMKKIALLGNVLFTIENNTLFFTFEKDGVTGRGAVQRYSPSQ